MPSGGNLSDRPRAVDMFLNPERYLSSPRRLAVDGRSTFHECRSSLSQPPSDELSVRARLRILLKGRVNVWTANGHRLKGG